MTGCSPEKAGWAGPQKKNSIFTNCPVGENLRGVFSHCRLYQGIGLPPLLPLKVVDHVAYAFRYVPWIVPQFRSGLVMREPCIALKCHEAVFCEQRSFPPSLCIKEEERGCQPRYENRDTGFFLLSGCICHVRDQLPYRDG